MLSKLNTQFKFTDYPLQLPCKNDVRFVFTPSRFLVVYVLFIVLAIQICILVSNNIFMSADVTRRVSLMDHELPNFPLPVFVWGRAA
jgi:hypothetical protein